MVNWTEYKPIREQKGNGDLADIVAHASNPSAYAFPDSEVTTVHETTHCVNADLRNARIAYKRSAYANQGISAVGLIVPSSEYRAGTYSLYALKNRSIKLVQPNTKKSDSAKYVPEAIRYYRFKTYIAGQTDWDRDPLYIFDEYIAYVNGADNLIEQINQNRVKEDGQDYLFAPVEFISYGVAALMAADKANGLNQDLIDFTKWIVGKSMFMFYGYKEKAPWKQMDECVDKLLTSSECVDIRSFLKNKMNFELPTTAIDPDVSPIDVDI